MSLLLKDWFLFGCLAVGLTVTVCVAIIHQPDGMFSNILAELIGLFVGGIIFQVILQRRDRKLVEIEKAKQAESSVLLCVGPREKTGKKEIPLTLFFAEFRVWRASDIVVWLVWEGGSKTTIFSEMNKTYNRLDMEVRLTSLAHLDKVIELNNNRKPASLVIEWLDYQNNQMRKIIPYASYSAKRSLLKPDDPFDQFSI